MKTILYFMPRIAIGGAERVTHVLLKHLDRSKYKMVLVTLRETTVGDKFKDLFDSLGVEMVCLNKRGWWDIPSVVFKIVGLIQKYQPSMLLSVIGYGSYILFFARKLLKGFHSLPVVIVEHSYPSRALEEQKFYSLFKYLTGYIYRSASMMIAVSNGVRDDLINNFGILPEYCTTIFNPVDIMDISQLAKEQVEHEWFRQPEVPVIVTCGRLVQCKNFELLIRAVGEVIKQMPVRLALIGDGVERSNLEYLVRKLGLEKSVVFLGFQVNPYKYLKRSTVFALSSDIESFGLVLVEAMICGIPVVSTDCPSGPREIVTHEKNGLLSPVRDINKLADNILCVLKNKALSQEFVNANKVVVTMFDPNKITDEYQRMINEVCEKDKHLVLAGLNFDFELQQGDKNFWIELINEISGKFNRITIITIKQADMEMSEFMLGQCKVVIKYKSPFILATPGKLRRGLFQVNWQGRAFPSELAVVEKFFVGYGILRLLNQIFKHIQYGNVHLMDNMGFTNRSIAQFASSHGAGTTVSAISYQGHNVNIYHMYLKMSYQNKNLKVVPYSECFAAKLEQIGIPRKSLVQIHWGIKNDEVTFNTEQEIIAMRTELGLSKDKVVILWSGFIQQIRERSFMLAYHAAVEAVKLGLNAEFYFAFKPESFNEKYFGMAAKGVKISVTGIKQFVKLKSCCDIFYSPIINPQYIIAPPLTWIEVMNLGKPIVTTVAGGVDEIVEDGVTGFIANNEEELIKKLFVAVESYKQMKNMCISKVKEKYSIKRIGEQYVKMFNNGQ